MSINTAIKLAKMIIEANKSVTLATQGFHAEMPEASKKQQAALLVLRKEREAYLGGLLSAMAVVSQSAAHDVSCRDGHYDNLLRKILVGDAI